MDIIKMETISPSLIERGEVKKWVLMRHEGFEVSLMKLAPFTKIKRHKHTKDWEIYFYVKSKTVSICEVGEEHELENPSTNEMLVISVKIPAGMNAIE
ncbi:MAG: hypothetical protein HFJ54_06025 [Clostridia bacterium]|nr:hypothetical protein [Clostridia bacterium]